MSIRLRLTLWYTFILTALLVVIGVTVVSTFAATLQADVDRTLDETAVQVISASSAVPDPRLLPSIRVNIPVEANVFQAPGLYLLVVDLNGQVLRRSQSMGDYNTPLDAAGIISDTTRPIDELRTRREVTIGTGHLRVLTYPIVAPTDELIGYLQVGVSLNANDEALAQLIRILFFVGAGGVILAAIGGALLARQALRPIAAMTETALSITDAGDLSRRISEPNTHDEVDRLAGTFNRMLGRLEHLFRAQRRFTADVSHELRTPLTTIRGNLDLMRRTRVCDDASLDAMQSEAERMTRLVGDLLLLAQTDSGQPLRREPVSLDTLMLEVYRQIKVIADGVLVRIGDEDRVTVIGDPDRLKQVILNLADNAIRYTPSGQQVTLSLKRVNDWAQLSVSDTGPGIAAEHLEHIFERFYRVDKSRSRHDADARDGSGSGSGLGLSIVKSITESHGGRVEVQSRIGHGATFTVYLPVSDAQSHALNGNLADEPLAISTTRRIHP
jgi:heavy metal sensor kinase